MSLVQFRHRPLATSIFDEFFNHDWLPTTRYNSPVPAVNIHEGEKAFILELAVPGKSKNDFEIQLDQDVLSITAEAANQENEPTNTFSHKEFNYSAFKRAFTFPDSVDPSKIKAKYIHGILRVELPKREEVLPQPSKRIAIE